ncbi:MAG: hypothetical protein QNI87_10430 [Erythrobacter sp.]|uniref:hypothetical protein n=1 Tax=Erythrobacter sp. TaxID=1042 RepID=UPI00261D7265|nr:hypothetical protein [Erythrobacter sp.]MDJ0978941.1 hypothetical protein [Erythrobacter sp.]
MPISLFLTRAFCLSALAVLCVSSLAAQRTEPDTKEPLDFSGMRPSDLVAEFDKDPARWYEEPCVFGVPIAAALQEVSPDDAWVQRTSLFARALCAAHEDRFEDGIQRVRELREVEPEAEYAALTLFLAAKAKDAQLALDLFSWLDSESMPSLTRAHFWPAYRTIREAGREDELSDRTLAWFESGLIEQATWNMEASLADSALDAAARQGRDDMVDDLLAAMSRPDSYIDLLTERRYAAFWPQIEERAGANLSAVGEENVAKARQGLEENPDDSDKLSDLARALHYHGEYQAVIDLVNDALANKEGVEEIEEGDAWALNLQAYAYDSLGQTDKADAIFDRLASLDPERNHWVVSFVINRASRLVGYSRFAEGLEAARLARTVPGTTYAEMIVAKDHACALNALGRAEEAELELAFLRDNKSASVALAATGLLCHGLRDEAAQILLEGLRDPSTRSSALDALRPPEADLFYTQSILPDTHQLLEDHAELLAELEQLARPLPEAMVPRAATLRADLELPNWEERVSAAQ